MKLDEDIKKIIDMLNFSNGKYDIKDIFRDVVLLEGHFINNRKKIIIIKGTNEV